MMYTALPFFGAADAPAPQELGRPETLPMNAMDKSGRTKEACIMAMSGLREYCYIVIELELRR